ncbi:7-deoxyloganetin glucosyltransferase-like [Olea europaea var. sylvestris]|uniref:7-deoxyloganetin glucosyltransferase-like n=1 Tax=Olea europaea var. sylvestris TaxID=158386 RepID=UPI000C1D45F8|nr:7-deoxyloganetin glucosyltransferase-like [Olea europaea var. sylvestris]
MVSTSSDKPHAVCIPYPAQGHVNPMLKLAKLLHHHGFYITFVHTEYNYKRLLKSRGPAALEGPPDFRFETIPDGLPPSDADATQDIPSLCESTSKTCLLPFCSLLTKLNNAAPEVPPVTCIVSDGVMSFTVKAAEQFGLPEVLFWTTSACGFLGYTQYRPLVDKGYTPLEDMSQVTNGYLETSLDWVPGTKDIRLRDIPSFIRTTDSNDLLLNFLMSEVEAVPKAKALIFNTFDALEQDVLDALSAMYPRIYTVGPLQLMMNNIHDERYNSLSSSLWKENSECINWLNTKEPNSVVYVNFGSITVVTAQQLTEFAWGLANSKKSFLWIIRPDIVAGDSAMLPPEFLTETEDRSMLVSWCPQEQVLKHPAIGGFLTHSGWNSTIESIGGGVPVICWPFFAEQQTNCRYSCVEWGMGMEIDNNVKRDEVEKLVRELMDGEKRKKMKEKTMEWKKKAEEATVPGGSSYMNVEKLVKLLQ